MCTKYDDFRVCLSHLTTAAIVRGDWVCGGNENESHKRAEESGEKKLLHCSKEKMCETDR